MDERWIEGWMRVDEGGGWGVDGGWMEEVDGCGWKVDGEMDE